MTDQEQLVLALREAKERAEAKLMELYAKEQALREALEEILRVARMNVPWRASVEMFDRACKNGDAALTRAAVPVMDCVGERYHRQDCDGLCGGPALDVSPEGPGRDCPMCGDPGGYGHVCPEHSD